MTGTKPTKFEDLDKKELYRSAIEDFAIDVEPGDNKKTLIAAFAEANLSWADYVAQHPEVKPDEPVVNQTSGAAVNETPVTPTERTPEPQRAGTTVTSSSLKGEEEEEVVIITKRELPVNTTERYLVKMERENPLFEIHGYRFTQENPYNLVPPEVANKILREDGFVLARPDEVQEFYS
jgi:hypothetical protein